MNKKYLILGTVITLILIGAGYSIIMANKKTVITEKIVNTENCAKEGEVPTDLDIRTGKIIPEGRTCCDGLKEILPKTDSATLKQGLCLKAIGGTFPCAPCGDNVCDDKYEDKCNCPEDCK